MKPHIGRLKKLDCQTPAHSGRWLAPCNAPSPPDPSEWLSYNWLIAYSPEYDIYGWGGDGHPSLFGDLNPRDLNGLPLDSLICTSWGLSLNSSFPDGLEFKARIPSLGWEAISSPVEYGIASWSSSDLFEKLPPLVWSVLQIDFQEV